MRRISRQQFQNIVTKVLYRTYIKELILRTPGHGETKDNWDIKFEGDRIIIYNEPTGDNIRFTNDGTVAHNIYAKDKKFLRFKVDKNKKAMDEQKGSKVKIPGNIAFEKDGYVFAKAVHHPGIQAQHYVEAIMNDKTIEAEARKLLEQEIEMAIK